jgi:hypothetical protein
MRDQSGVTVSDTPLLFRRLRDAALVALIVGAFGSIGLLLHAKRHPPPLLVVLFVIWVLSPFVILVAAYVKSKRWAPSTQRTLYAVTVLVSVVSVAVYADDAVSHRTTHPAFVYVAVPPASWLFSAIVLSIAALKAKRT